MGFPCAQVAGMDARFGGKASCCCCCWCWCPSCPRMMGKSCPVWDGIWDGKNLWVFGPCFCERFATFPKVQGHQSENLYTNDSRTQIGRHLHSLPKSCFGRLPTTFAVFFFVSECHPFVSEFSVRGGLRNNSLGLTIHGILKPFFKKTIDSFPKTLVHSNEVEAQKWWVNSELQVFRIFLQSLFVSLSWTFQSFIEPFWIERLLDTK